MSAGEGSASGSSPGVKPGALTALLEELAVAPEEAQGGAWEGLLRAGAVIGRFELVRELGHGGFGVVWEARDRELGRSVAFKAVRAGGKTTVREERLLKEAEAAARLQHPNIVTLHDVGRAEQGPYLILELLKGHTLAERRAQGTLPLREALRIGVEVAKGVAHAHAHGVVHRDLTPGNVFLCEDGQVKVLDFGMAHAFGQRKVDGGTRAYMAPEQARGAPEDERTDVFALGVILYEMLSSELPFPDAEALASASPAPGLEVPEAPALGELVGRMLEKDSVKRPRDGGEVLSALTTFQQELERLPSTASAPVRTRRPSSGLRDLFGELKRRRVIRALVGYAIVSFAVLQVVEPVLHGLHLPDSTLSVIIVLLGIGFPVTVALAWVFDLTAGGVATTPERKGTGLRGPRLALLLVGLGVLAAAPGLGWYFLRQRTTPPAEGKADVVQAPTAPSVAVLPFADLSPQHDQDYFSDGIAEEILDALAQVDGLRVVGRTSSFAFKGKNEDLTAIAQKLRVNSVLEGSVRKEGSRVRISAQLVNATDGFHLWSQTFDRELTGVFTIQDEIARSVVDALKVKLLTGWERARADRGPRSAEAYQQYLLGRDYQRRSWTERNGRLAAEAFQKALALDAGYAPAWAGFSWALTLLADYAATSAGSAELQQRSLAAAEKAIAIDPSLPDGYLARADILAWDVTGAEADIERALALVPGDARANRDRGIMLMSLGRVREGIVPLRKAVDLDPLAAPSWVSLARAHLVLGDTASARAALERGRELIPDGPFVWYFLGLTSLLEGQPAAALAAFERVSVEGARTTGIALAQHSLGQPVAAQEALDALTSRFAHVSAYQIAEVNAWWGERDAAFEWLERAYRQHDGGLTDLKCDLLLRSLRGDPRYTALLKKMNLPVD